MAPSRGRGKTRAASSRSTPARATRSTRKTKDVTPDVYEEMLAEEAKRSPQADVPERPLKRRRVAAGVHIPKSDNVERQGSAPAVSSPASSPPNGTTKGKGKARARPVQTIEASSDDDSGDESDFAFEDVDLDNPTVPGPAPGLADDDEIADVSISVDPATTAKPRAIQVRRKPASSAEKALRLLTHKAHILCLLGHGMYVNTWCNDITVQQHLHPLLSKKTLSYLQGKEHYSQFQRDRSFREGLEHASEVFGAHYKVNASGMRRSMPGVDGAELGDDVDPVSRHDLIMAAREMEGSQDTGNQLFCALLRSAGVEARLIFSMQPLPLSSSQAKQATPQKPSKPVIRAMPPYGDPVTSDSNTDDNAVKGSSTIGKVPSARRRLGQPSFNSQPTTPTSSAAPSRRKRPVRKLDYPIFWVEAFNPAHQKWTSVDPLVTKTIGKPSKFEPPSSYAQNQMSYVIAFEEDGVARDVTRRYAKAFIAKTRRIRVESTESGAQWLKKALRLFRRRGGILDRDQTEDAELNQKEAREGLPNNVQDFKDHPTYALERHLKRHEIIEPKREVGKVNAGTAAKPRMEPVYRRSDVLVCRSADKWYRLGREIQQGQAPIKHVPARNIRGRRSLSPDAEANDVAGAGMTPLYAQYQTEAYIAPPVVKGKVPRNTFGNLDIYVPSMVPPGGTHIRHALAQQAARTLRIDFADAVTGFQFKGRHGTAIIQGAVVPSQYAEAVEATIDGLLNERLEEESLARSAVALRMWKRFLTGLRIKERIDTYGTDGATEDVREQIDRQVDEHEEIAEAGGFFAEEPAMPTAGKFSLVEMARAAAQTPAKKAKKRKDESESEVGPESSDAGSEGEETQLRTRRSTRARRTVVENDEEDDKKMADATSSYQADETVDDLDGGFLPGEGDAELEGGGFVPEADGDADDEEGGGFIAQEHDPVDHDGGGFVPGEHGPVDDDGGGGFLMDDDQIIEGNGDHRIAESGDGFLPDAEDDEDGKANAISARVDAQSPPSIQTMLVNDPAEPPVKELDEASASAEASIVTKADDPGNLSMLDDSLSMHGALQTNEIELQAAQTLAPNEVVAIPESIGTDPAIPTAEIAEKQDDQDSDRGSMISHDPEDEDAEPDWLESD